MRKAMVVLALLCQCACSTTPKPFGASDAASSANEVDRFPASAREIINSRWRVLKPINVSPTQFGNQRAVLVSNGRILSGSEARDILESKNPRILKYCAFYLKSDLRIAANEILNIGANVPSSAHWEPGQIFDLRSEDHPEILGFGCFSLSADAPARITSQDVQDHLDGIAEKLK